MNVANYSQNDGPEPGCRGSKGSASAQLPAEPRGSTKVLVVTIKMPVGIPIRLTNGPGFGPLAVSTWLGLLTLR